MIEKIQKYLQDNNCIDKEMFTLLQEVEEKLQLAEKIEQCLYDSDLYMVYKHTDPRGKVYIGITQNHPQTRWNEGGGYEKQSKFYKAIQKYGWIHFKHEILAAALTREEALELENEMIIKYNSYKDEYGYNTRVDLKVDCQEKTQLHSEKNTKSKKKNVSSISQELVEKYTIKTVNGQIYYLKDDEYVLEKDYPLLEKELILAYSVPTKLHKEIIKQIEIISCVPISSISEEERDFFIKKHNQTILRWMKINGLTKEWLLKNSTGTIYDSYEKWSMKVKDNTALGKKQFFKHLEEEFGLEKKQRSDGKRYFIAIDK